LSDLIIQRSIYIGTPPGVLTNATSVVLSDPTGAYGVRRADTLEIIVADGTVMELTSTGVYTYIIEDAVAGVTYEYWVEVLLDGDTYRKEGTITAPSGNTRATPADVTAIIDFDPSISNLQPFIDAAEELVNEVCAPAANGYSAARLKIIEIWLAAHFLAIRDPRYSAEGMGGANASYITGQAGLNLSATPYGQQCRILDTKGGLAWLDVHISQGKRARAGITWLGTEQSSRTNFPYRYLSIFQ
jgi:hypothetical protein